METTGSFKGRVAFVTGAASGIGRAAALAFANAGASVVAADVTAHANEETARMIEQAGGRALAVRCDVTQAADIKAALGKTIASFGRIDFAFNNAGIEPRAPAPTADYDEDEWNRIIDIDHHYGAVALLRRRWLRCRTRARRRRRSDRAIAGGLQRRSGSP